MSLTCGIVGLPNVGKSTLFNALSSKKAEVANFPFCTIKPNVSIISVPDERLEILSGLVNPQQVLPTTFEFVDIAGLVKGASKGEGLGNQFLAHIREVDAIAHVVRCFESDSIARVVDGQINPLTDIDIIDTELQLKDLELVEKRISKIERHIKSGETAEKKEYNILLQCRHTLSAGKNVRHLEADPDEKKMIENLQLLTSKPVIYVANVDESSIQKENTHVQSLKQHADSKNTEVITICGALEAQIAELENETDKQAFLQEYGLTRSGLNRFIQSAYRLLHLQTFFTAGKKEVRAWTIKKGWTAPKAAGVIHSDFEKGFIRAEVVKLDDYQKYKTEAGCREAGRLAVEGKDYVVCDGDIMHFRFNV